MILLALPTFTRVVMDTCIANVSVSLMHRYISLSHPALHSPHIIKYVSLLYQQSFIYNSGLICFPLYCSSEKKKKRKKNKSIRIRCVNVFFFSYHSVCRSAHRVGHYFVPPLRRYCGLYRSRHATTNGSKYTRRTAINSK